MFYEFVALTLGFAVYKWVLGDTDADDIENADIGARTTTRCALVLERYLHLLNAFSNTISKCCYHNLADMRCSSCFHNFWLFHGHCDRFNAQRACGHVQQVSLQHRI